MRSRRSFLRLTGGAAGAAFATARYGIDQVAALTAQAAAGGRTPAQVAADEDYWREIQFAFTLDRTLINLNNGNSCPCPTVVREAWKRYDDWGNQSPVYHRGMTERNLETVRRKLAAEIDQILVTVHPVVEEPELFDHVLLGLPDLAHSGSPLSPPGGFGG